MKIWMKIQAAAEEVACGLGVLLLPVTARPPFARHNLAVEPLHRNVGESENAGPYSSWSSPEGGSLDVA